MFISISKQTSLDLRAQCNSKHHSKFSMIKNNQTNKTTNTQTHRHRDHSWDVHEGTIVRGTREHEDLLNVSFLE